MPVYSSLGVAQGTTLQACQQLACQIYPNIPECGQPPVPSCSDREEVQSLACQPNYSGSINQTRTYQCQTSSYTAWTTTSNNCSPNPPTCTYSAQTEERQTCGDNKIGSVTYKREQNCQDPYGSPVDSGWFEISNSCQPAPATCQTTVENQTLACQQHFSGSIQQTKASSCPNPYGSPVSGEWVTVSNSCTQDPPTCSASSVTKEVLCPQNFSGSITETNTATCSDPYGSQIWTGYVVTNNSCTPNPATCSSSTQTRTLACQDGFIGSITENRVSTCSTPYSEPQWSDWISSQNSCVKSATNPTNMSSPVNPASPLSATAMPEVMPTAPAPEAPPVMNTESPADIAEPPPEAPPPAEAPPPTAAAPPPTASSGSTSTPPSQPAVSAPTTTSQGSTQNTSPVQVPAGKTLVQGFGLVMSLEILNKPMQIQQVQLNEAMEYQQELPYELRGNQGVLLQLITEGNISDAFNNLASDRWDSLRRNNDLQPCYSCD